MTKLLLITSRFSDTWYIYTGDERVAVSKVMRDKIVADRKAKVAAIEADRIKQQGIADSYKTMRKPSGRA